MFTFFMHIVHFLYTRLTFFLMHLNIFRIHDVYFQILALNIFFQMPEDTPDPELVNLVKQQEHPY